MEGNVGARATANNCGKENVCQFGTNVEENKPMSSIWSTGVGPRIGCMREYPANFQVLALELLNLSPRVNDETFAGKAPIPSPRPSTKHMSLVSMGLPSPMVHVSPLQGLWTFKCIGIALVLAFKNLDNWYII